MASPRAREAGSARTPMGPTFRLSSVPVLLCGAWDAHNPVHGPLGAPSRFWTATLIEDPSALFPISPALLMPIIELAHAILVCGRSLASRPRCHHQPAHPPSSNGGPLEACPKLIPPHAALPNNSPIAPSFAMSSSPAMSSWEPHRSEPACS